MLEFMKRQFDTLGLPYEFDEWTADAPDVYFTGEWSSEPIINESGEVKGRFILVGHSYIGNLALEQWRQTLYTHFRDGIREVNGDRAHIAWYSNAQVVPTDIENFKRIEIYFDVRDWRA